MYAETTNTRDYEEKYVKQEASKETKAAVQKLRKSNFAFGFDGNHYETTAKGTQLREEEASKASTAGASSRKSKMTSHNIVYGLDKSSY